MPMFDKSIFVMKISMLVPESSSIQQRYEKSNRCCNYDIRYRFDTIILLYIPGTWYMILLYAELFVQYRSVQWVCEHVNDGRQNDGRQNVFETMYSYESICFVSKVSVHPTLPSTLSTN